MGRQAGGGSLNLEIYNDRLLLKHQKIDLCDSRKRATVLPPAEWSHGEPLFPSNALGEKKTPGTLFPSEDVNAAREFRVHLARLYTARAVQAALQV